MARNPSLQLAALATVAIPGLDVVATRAPQRTTTDYRYCGVLDDAGRHWVVQAPLHASAAIALDAEAEVLRQLVGAVRDDALPFDVANPEGFAPLPEGRRVMVYRELPGRELDIDALRPGPGPSVSLGRAIAAIHELRGTLIADSGLPVYDAASYRSRRLAEVDDAARTGKVPPVLLNRWELALEDIALWRFRATPVHGDLAPENVLMANGQVVAVVNWSNAHVGDPAEDLAWLYAAAPEESLDTLEEAYAMGRSEPPDPHLVSRALLYSELAVTRWLMHGVRIESSEIIADAEGMLTTLARQVEDSAPIGHVEPTVRPVIEVDTDEIATDEVGTDEVDAEEPAYDVSPVSSHSPDVARTAVTAYSPDTAQSLDAAGDAPPDKWKVRGSLEPEDAGEVVAVDFGSANTSTPPTPA
ncbi:MAG: phosphotransferase [Actinomycetota bacterium]